MAHPTTTSASHTTKTGSLPGAPSHASILICCMLMATLLPLISCFPMQNCHMNSGPIDAPIVHLCNPLVGLMAAGLPPIHVSSQLPPSVCGGHAPPSPPSATELCISKLIDIPTCLSSGIGLAEILAGRFGSSTRAEIAGGILHILAPGPAHIGTDSQAFLSKAKKVLEAPCLAPRRPFALRTDGDLWQAFTQLAIDKGPNSIAISWHRAHAKLGDMLTGKVGLEASMHNSIADWLADRGHEAQGVADLRAF